MDCDGAIVDIRGTPDKTRVVANGAEGDRTLNLRIANAALSQLSYRPSWFFTLKYPQATIKAR
jgi:hypothetical protein